LNPNPGNNPNSIPNPRIEIRRIGKTPACGELKFGELKGHRQNGQIYVHNVDILCNLQSYTITVITQ